MISYLNIRLFNHFCYFLFKIIRQPRLSETLFPGIQKKENSRTRSQNDNIDCQTPYNTYSFTNLSIDVLNKFLDLNTGKSEKEFRKFVYSKNLELYKKCKDFFNFIISI